MSLEDHPEYDANILSTGPAPTRTKFTVQPGYATNPPQPPRGDLESGRKLLKHTPIPNGAKATAGVEPKAAPTTPLPQVTAKTPFYRTKRGIIILVIVAIVILAAIIGGAVGGALGKGSVSSVSQQIYSTMTTDPGQGGAVPDPTSPSLPGAASTSTIRFTTTLSGSTVDRVTRSD